MGPIEKEEFDPTIYTAEYVTVETGEPIQSILERVEEAWTRSPNVILIIPRGTEAFHTTHDFLLLGKIGGGREVRVSLASSDATISGLARVLGFHVVDLDDQGSSAEGDSVDENEVEKPTAPLPLGTLPGLRPGSEWIMAPAPSPIKPSSLTTSAWLGNPDDYVAYEDGTNPWAGARPQSPARPAGGEHAASHSEAKGTGKLPAGEEEMVEDYLPVPASISALHEEEAEPFPMSTTPSGRIKARRVILAENATRNVRGMKYDVMDGLRGNIHWGRWLLGFAAVLALGVALAIGYIFVYLPEGQVAVTPLNKTYTSLPVEVAVLLTGGAPSDAGKAAAPSTPGGLGAAAVDAIPIKAAITEEDTRPASGTRQVARGKGQGTMHFTNRTSNAVTVPTGARFKAPNGVLVQVTQGGTVPPTIFGQSFGTLDLPIAAMVEGPDGNIEEGDVSGVYSGVLNYSNSAMQGGTTETIKVVTQADIDALAADLRTRAESKVGSAVLSMVAGGQQLITQTVSLANVGFAADHKAGEDGASVHVTLTGEAQAFAYSENDLHDSIVQAMLRWVTANTPSWAGPVTDQDSIEYADPSVTAVQDGKVIYATTVSARVTFNLTAELARQIRDLVKGKDLQEARNLITRTYGGYVNTSTVQAKALWFTLDHLPGDPTRIDVEVATSSGSSPGGSASSGLQGSRP